MESALPTLASQFHGQAEVAGEQACALVVSDGVRARRPAEADVVKRAPKRQAVFAHEPDSPASGPGQLGGP